MEKEYKISWLKVLGVFGVIGVVVITLCLIPNNSSKGIVVDPATFINNINLMKDAGYDYFQGSKLPVSIGESTKMTLEELLSNNIVIEFADENGNSCNKEDSYIEVTKKLDNEYRMKVFLSCDSKSDYVISTIVNKENIINNSINKEKEEEKNNVAENSNLSKVNSTSEKATNNKYNASSSSDKKVTYVTNYNIKYINSCKSCTTLDCENNCLANVYYTVSFDSKGGSKVDSQTIKHGALAKYESSKKEGYTFKGWYLDGEKYDFNSPVTKKITLVAKWEEINIQNNTYVVNFETNGGSLVSNQEVEEGQLVRKPKNPTKTCYKFSGWYTTKKLTEKFDFATEIYEDTTLYAKWIDDDSCKNTYTVSFESNGGSKVASVEVVEGDTIIEPENPTKACYSFSGWYTNKNLTNKFSFKNSIISDMTLYAKWIADNSCKESYTVKFDSKGGTTVNTQIVEEGQLVKEPNEPVKDGYIFKGWYLDGKLYDFQTDVYEDITLYAKWSKESVKYNTYCLVKEERVYSTSYVGKDIVNTKNLHTYDYVLKYKNSSATNLKLIDYGNTINNYQEYNKAYNYLIKNTKPITMVGYAGGGIDPGSATNLKEYSLKANNFRTKVSYDYHKGTYWYFNITNTLSNLDNIKNAEAFYTSDSWYVYFVPLFFDIKYTDTSECVEDLANNASKYQDKYDIIDTYYK